MPDWQSLLLPQARKLDQLQQEATRLGANATFSRPFDMDDLRTVVLNAAPHV